MWWWHRSRWPRVIFTSVAVAGVVTVGLESWLPGRWAAVLGVGAGIVLALVTRRTGQED